MRTLITALTIASTALIAPVTAHASTGAPYATDQESVTVAKIVTEKRTGCTGILVDTQWVLTAAHCFPEHIQSGTITFGNSVEQSALGYAVGFSYVTEHPKQDLALVKLDNAVPLTYATVASEVPSWRSPVTMYGWGGKNPLLTRLDMQSKKTDWNNIVFKTDLQGANVVPGDSGGPVLNERNEVVGITSSTFAMEGEEFHSVNAGNPARARSWIYGTMGKQQELTINDRIDNVVTKFMTALRK